jgi:hypothetical protein
MVHTSRNLLAVVIAIVAAALLLPAHVAQAAAGPEQPVVLRTDNGELHGILPGCPPCGGVGLVPAAHNYGGAVAVFDAATGERVGQIVAAESRHAHLTCAAARQTPVIDDCFVKGTDVLPDTTLDLTIVLDDDRGLTPTIRIKAHGDTVVDRRGDGDSNVTSMEIRDTVLKGETDSGVPVVVRLGKSFGLPPTEGEARRIKKATLPEYVTVVAKANAEIIIGWPEQVSIKVEPSADQADALRVAVLSDDDFDAGSIDRQRLTFGPTGEEARLGACDAVDVDGDGRDDLACDIDARAAGFDPGAGEGRLHGLTRAGRLIEGRASFDAGTRAATLD